MFNYMRNTCSLCKRNNCRVKQLDNDYFCQDCLDEYRCSKCNSLYDSCVYCHKKLCDCVEWEVDYDYAGHMILCRPCFELQDPEIQLYFYFRDKYKEQLTLEQIQQIIKNNKNKL